MSETDDNQPLVTLSEGQSQPADSEVMPATSGIPLNDDEVQAILSRLPNMTAEEPLQEDFNLPGEPIPAPKTGETIEQTFPPEESVEAAATEDSGPLEVVRYSPEGEIPVAPFISITFNQPMVPLSTLEQLNAMDIPIQVEPELEGTWRWLGTKTLTFQSDSELYDRIPKATEFKITIPAGTTSQTGGVLADEVSFSFTTPPLALDQYYPKDDQQSDEPLIFISFNQRINADALMPHLTLKSDNKTYDLQLVSEDEYQENKKIQYYVDNALEGRFMVVKPAKAIDLDTYYSVVVNSGAPSAEGPLLTQNDLSFGFSTYAPLKIDEYGCSWSDSPCQPFSPLFIRFNNTLDMKAYEEGWLTIEPAIDNVNANIYGNNISIQGSTAAQTTYTIVVSKDVQDIFGQTLGKDQTLKFRIGKATPTLVGPQENFITVDPSSKNPALTVYAMNYSKLDVEIYRVQPSDWPDFMTYMEEFNYKDNPPEVPGDCVFNKTISVEGSDNELHQVDIDLKSHMDGSSGQFIVIVKPPKPLFSDNSWQTIQTWVQVTPIGLDAFLDHSEMIAWTTRLKDGSPLSNVTIASDKSGTIGSTDEDGLLNFAIPDSARYLTATSGADSAMLPNNTWPWDDAGWRSRPTPDSLIWYIFDDRAMYKPGEEVHIKGWIRRLGSKQGSDVNLIGSGTTTVNYSIMGPYGNELGTGTVDVNAFGGFDFVYQIPEEVNLGYASIEFSANGPISSNTYHQFQIQEFRRPEFEVSARNESSGPYFAGDEATVAVDANYYAGGALPNAETNWNVSTTQTTYTPPNWSDFTFGSWTPWWYYSYDDSYDTGNYYETFSGITDAAGTHYLNLTFGPNLNARPLSVSAEATVMDVNRQAWTSSTNLLVHPASLYIGMRTDRYFVKQGQPLNVEFVVTDIDGNPVTDRVVEIEAARMEWKTGSTGWHQEAVDVQTCKTGSTEEPGLCTFETPVGGTYQITATITDEMGRTNQSSMNRWVSGGNRPTINKVEQEQVTLIPDKDDYEAGETAEILVQSPFGPANGIMTVARDGILYTEAFTMTEDTIILEVPIEEGYTPNVNVQIDLAGSAVRTDTNGNEITEVEPRPAYGTGVISLSVPPTKRELTVEAIPQDTEMEPGGSTDVDIKVTDASGQPVNNAEVALVVVDESILALTNYQVSDPMSIFYTNHSSDLSVYYSRSHILLVDVQNLVAENQEKSLSTRDAVGGFFGENVIEEAAPAEAPAMEMAMDTASAAEDGGAATQAIAIRSDFNPLANFSPTVTTDERGEATVRLDLPDNLTRYRVIAIAVDESGKKFGASESSITARLPLMVRPSAPRFLNFGDEFELPVILQNQTDEDLSVQVALRAANLSLTDYAGLQVTVPANDRIEVRFPSKADMAGTASFQVAAVSGRFSDAATIDLPVYTPATTEAFATYGTIDSGSIAQPLASPQDVFPQYGGLEITTSSTALQALTDAVMYLVNYPYLCSEQVSSRILGIAALRDVLTAFEADGLPSPEEMEASVETGITRLEGMQNWDGGFPVWKRGDPSNPFNTIHAAHALQRAKDKGFDVPDAMQQNVLTYLTDIESHYPSWYSDYTRRNLSSYALYVRALMGDVDGYKAQSLIDQYGLDSFNLSSVGWLYQVFLQADGYPETLNEIRTLIANRVVETPSAANFTTEYNEQAYLLLESDRRTDAILLDAMIMDDPDSDLIPKVVNGLLAHRTRGRWGNTQENVFVLLALDNYFNTYESETPDFVARMWLGETYAGSHTYEGYSTDQQETMIPMNYLVEGDDLQDLIISKEGAGRLYYRMGLRYAPTDLQMDALDMGFVVNRVYEAVNDPEDVTLDNDGVWHIKAGAEVRVRITLTADNRRYHVAMADPLPAGLEIVNPELAVSSTDSETQADPSYRSYWWWGPWYEHQNLRDERAEAFTSLLWDGTYQYSYLTRATTPGRFVAPPTKVEEMYTPEVFGRSASDIVIVE
jgi:alpha-2-macroglobulin